MACNRKGPGPSLRRGRRCGWVGGWVGGGHSGIAAAIDTLFVGIKRIDHSMARLLLGTSRERQTREQCLRVEEGRHRTVPQTTTSDADSSISPESFTTHEDTLLGTLLLHHASQTSPCNLLHCRLAERDKRALLSTACRHRTMPQTTTSDADSSISPASCHSCNVVCRHLARGNQDCKGHLGNGKVPRRQ